LITRGRRAAPEIDQGVAKVADLLAWTPLASRRADGFLCAAFALNATPSKHAATFGARCDKALTAALAEIW
jgi:hypothetical protein